MFGSVIYIILEAVIDMCFVEWSSGFKTLLKNSGGAFLEEEKSIRSSY